MAEVKARRAWRLWTPEELEILRRNASGLETKGLQKLLPQRSLDGIDAKAKKLGISRLHTWTQANIENLFRFYPVAPQSVVQAHIPNHAWPGIHYKALMLGLHRPPPRLVKKREAYPNDLILAWVAGFLDGDGYIYIAGSPVRRKYYLQVGIANRDKPALDFIQRYLGGSIITTGNSKDGWAPLYRWYVTANRALRILQSILPHLRVKRKQAELAIEFQKNHGRMKGHIMTEECIANYKAQQQKISALNRYRNE